MFSPIVGLSSGDEWSIGCVARKFLISGLGFVKASAPPRPAGLVDRCKKMQHTHSEYRNDAMNQIHEKTTEAQVAIDGLVQTTSVKPKKQRADGTDPERYAGLEKWSYKRWAWEFLRRNEDFRAACKQANATGSEVEKEKVAAEFGLKRYKSYNEAFRGSSGRPLFATGSISSWSRIDCEDDEGKKIRVTLDGGQVLIRFDLASALNDAKVLEKQLRLAEIRLEKRLKSYAANKKKQVQVGRHKVGTFGQYLRLLDLRAAGIRQIESGLLVAPKKARRLETMLAGKEDFAPAINKRMNRAIEYATELYRYLAVLKGRPSVKAIPLEQ